MRQEGHTANDCCKKSSREGGAGVVVGSLHEEASDSSRMDHDKANRGGEGRKGIDYGNAIIGSSQPQWTHRPPSTLGVFANDPHRRSTQPKIGKSGTKIKDGG